MFDETFSLLVHHKHTLSVAESCTGGGLSDAITSHPSVSSLFIGGITAYANRIKESMLNIPHAVLEEHGAVSEAVARVMADNCRQLFGTTWALSTTGIAGPGGGSREKPVGLVFIGLAGPHETTAVRFLFDHVSRMEHRRKTIEQAFLLLRERLR